MATPKAQMTRRRYGAGKLWGYTLGTPVLTDAWTPAGTASAFTLGNATGNVPGSASLLPLGITQDGMELTTSWDTDDDESAEYYYPHKTIVTGQSAKLAVELKTVNLTNLRLAFNAATTAVTGGPPSATVASRVRPPLPGEEVRCQLLWCSLANDIVIPVYQAFQSNDVSIAGKKGADGVTLDLEFNFEMPDAAVAPVPFDMWVIGASWIETVTTD